MNGMKNLPTRSVINKMAAKRIYYSIAEKWEISKRMPKGFITQLEKLIETELSTKAHHRGCLEKGQTELKFE